MRIICLGSIPAVSLRAQNLRTYRLHRPVSLNSLSINRLRGCWISRCPLSFLGRRRGDRVRRCEFISLFGGTAIAWPLAAHAQQSRDRARRIGVLIPEDAETEALVVAFRQRFQELGWTQVRNVQFDYRYTDGNPESTRSARAELVALAPDAILAYANPAVASLMQVTHTIPIVFTQASDPVGSGFVSNSAHPGGNITGFHSFE